MLTWFQTIGPPGPYRAGSLPHGRLFTPWYGSTAMKAAQPYGNLSNPGPTPLDTARMAVLP